MDEEIDNSTSFKTADHFPRFIVIKSNIQEKTITTLSPFVIEKQIEADILQKQLKSERTKHSLLKPAEKYKKISIKMTTFFNLPVTVLKHHTLITLKGIIRDRTLRVNLNKILLNT